MQTHRVDGGPLNGLGEVHVNPGYGVVLHPNHSRIRDDLGRRCLGIRPFARGQRQIFL
jgi:hypothetical protein